MAKSIEYFHHGLSGAHHQTAFQALLQCLSSENDTLKRRLSLDSWLTQHDRSLQQGMIWEEESEQSRLDWEQEYRAVIERALVQGLFYSHAYQQKLHSVYVETGRLSLNRQEQVLQQCLAQHLLKVRLAGPLPVLGNFVSLLKTTIASRLLR